LRAKGRQRQRRQHGIDRNLNEAKQNLAGLSLEQSAFAVNTHNG
jgi:hypothetical protein